MEEEGWVVAGAGKKSWKRRKGKQGAGCRGAKRRPCVPKQEEISWDPAVLDAPVEEGGVRALISRTKDAVALVRQSKIFGHLKREIFLAEDGGEEDTLVRNLGEVEELVVYGLGSLENGPPACRYQFALAVLLAEEIRKTSSKFGQVLFFDPAFTAYDRRAIESESSEFRVLRENENCARRTSKKTLFYMPHCEACLYDSLLKANWTRSQLPNLVILGNSFASYKSIWGVSSEHKPDPPAYVELVAAAESSQEVPVPDFNFTEVSAFNNMSFHFFPSASVAHMMVR
ncbi:SRR1 domain-containing protein [Chloropicon primus]|nr:SRR1 domain-containing protein [Chloropicon primus]